LEEFDMALTNTANAPPSIGVASLPFTFGQSASGGLHDGVTASFAAQFGIGDTIDNSGSGPGHIDTLGARRTTVAAAARNPGLCGHR